MYLKSEFKRRVVRLRDCLNYLLDNDGCLNENLHGFFPCLWSLFSLVWSEGCNVSCFLKSRGEDSVVYPSDVPFPFDLD